VPTTKEYSYITRVDVRFLCSGGCNTDMNHVFSGLQISLMCPTLPQITLW